jgi:Mn-dependent DtxR family transcriptional regulator
MGVSKVSVYRAAERLEKNGYAARDERNKVVITELGAKQLQDYMVIVTYISRALENSCGTPPEMAYQDAIGVVCALGEYSRSKVAEYAEAKAEIQLLKKPES